MSVVLLDQKSEGIQCVHKSRKHWILRMKKLATKINILNTILNLANDFCLVLGAFAKS